MAVANTKSTIVTLADEGRNVPLRLSGASCFEAVGTVEVAAGDDDDSVYRVVRLHSNASLRALYLINDAITGGTGFDVGLYATAEDGGEAIDADLFASGLDLSSARTTPTDVLYEALDPAKIEHPLWQAAGLAEDPHCEYDVALTGTTVGTGAGFISVRAQWVGTV